MDFSIAALVGTIAGVCSTSSFIPQVIKVWRDKDTEAISKKMYVVTVTAFSLWIVYGLMIDADYCLQYCELGAFRDNPDH